MIIRIIINPLLFIKVPIIEFIHVEDEDDFDDAFEDESLDNLDN